MDIKRSGSQPSGKGPADYFTGVVRIDPLFEAPEPARVRGASVTFEPGARTAWHTHPLGQTLIVIWGVGLAQHWGGAIEEIRPGDVIWFSPGEKHWHGATPTTAMTHIAVQEALNGKVVEWMEHVSDDNSEAKPDHVRCGSEADLKRVQGIGLLRATSRREQAAKHPLHAASTSRKSSPGCTVALVST